VISDVLFLWNPQRVNKKSLKRGLHYSLDGVHLNTFGAEILADAIIEALGGLAIDAGRL
jgi:lysophospholipase L1-like esterase